MGSTEETTSVPTGQVSEERAAIVIGERPIHPIAHQMAGQVLMMQALGMTPQVRTEDDPRFHRPEKISPDEFFISTGPGEDEGKYYACIMAPDKEVDDGYRVVAKCRYGFDDPESAINDAARQYPSLPCLQGTDSYVYPFYEVQTQAQMSEAEKEGRATHIKAVKAAEKKRSLRAQKMALQAIRTALGQGKLNCPGCKKPMHIKCRIVEGPNGAYAICGSCEVRHDVECLDPWEQQRAEDLGVGHDASTCACRCHEMRI